MDGLTFHSPIIFIYLSIHLHSHKTQDQDNKEERHTFRVIFVRLFHVNDIIHFEKINMLFGSILDGLESPIDAVPVLSLKTSISLMNNVGQRRYCPSK